MSQEEVPRVENARVQVLSNLLTLEELGLILWHNRERILVFNQETGQAEGLEENWSHPAINGNAVQVTIGWSRERRKNEKE